MKGGARLGIAVLLVLPFASTTALGAPGTVVQAIRLVTPNHFDPSSRADSPRPGSAGQPAPQIHRATTPARHAPGPSPAATVVLDPAKPGHLTSGDGAVELDVPAGAVTAGDVSAAGGKLDLLVRQVLPASGGSAGGSGHFTFGTYLVQVVGAGGRLASHGLRKPLGIELHVAGRAGAIDVDHSVEVVNRPLPPWLSLDPAPAAGGPSGSSAASSPRLGPASTQPATVDPVSQTLSASAIASGSSTTVSFDTVAPVAAFGAPDVTEVSPSAGALTLDYPLTLPAGPGGLTPPLHLTYDSANVSDQHNAAAAGPWVGEGWHLSLGKISWAERDIAAGCASVCPSYTWGDTWLLENWTGTRAELIPPSFTTSTYYEDSNGTAITPSPVGWRTSPDTHARVISYVGPNALPGMAANPPCFRVFEPSGMMEEYGCTADSLQFFPQPLGPNTGLDYIANWLPDLITDAKGNQIHVTYQTDTATGAGGRSYQRDAVMATVEYDSPGCHSPQTACTGTAWAPLMRVSFQASHSVAHVSGVACAANGSLRCDDPVDLSGSGGLAAPAIENTFVLNDALVQVRGSGSQGWNTLRDYQLAYDQAGPTTITDPFSGVAESTAGRLNLTRLTEIGADGSMALPSRTFGYVQQTQYYEDSLWSPAPAGNCGPSWNVSCNLWSQSYAGNSSYLATASNGLGLQQTFAWQDARDNSWGVPSGQDPSDPLVCDRMQTTHPCDVADDVVWSRIVLAQRTDGVVRLTQAGQGGAQTSTPVTGTYTYTYREGPVGDYWGDTFDYDVEDFYNNRFMGFASATVARPDGSTEVHRYPATLGIGVFDPNNSQFSGICTPTNPCTASPWWNPANAEHGREIELDRYNPDGSLVQVVKTQYQALCPSSGAGADFAGNLISELEWGNPSALCDVASTQADRYLVNGGSQSTAPHLTTTYARDAYGRVTSAMQTSSDGGATGSPTTIVRKLAYAWNDSVSATSTSATGSYLIDFPAFADVEDASGSRYQCRYASYDGNASTTGQTAGLTIGEVTRSDVYAACGTAANGFTPGGQISTSGTYDASGNLVGVDDPDALAGSSAHQGCAIGTATFSDCIPYDGTFGTLPVSSMNALGQVTTTAYGGQAAADSSGHGYGGAWTGGVTPGVAGLVPGDGGTAMSFDGATGEMDTSYGAASVTAYSVEAWIQTTSTASNLAIVQDRGGSFNAGPGKSLTLGLSFNNLPTAIGAPFFMLDSDSTAIGVWSPGAINDGRVHHLVGTWSGAAGVAVAPSQFTLYVDGVAVPVNQLNTGSATAPLSGSGGTKVARHDAWNSNLAGTVANVAVYRSALPAARVQAHFAGGPGYRAAVLADSPAAYYRLDGGSAQAPANTGFGLWPTAITDPNGQPTTFTYDPLGRQTSSTLPGETASITTTGTAYTFWCSGTAAQSPCLEIDRSRRLNSTTTVTARAFYDGLGHLVELRSPAPNGQDVVRYSLYDQSGRLAFESVPYFVGAYTGAPGASAYSIPDSSRAGTTQAYDGLDRLTSTTDALSHRRTTAYSMVCAATGTDAGCYEQILGVDRNGHQGGVLVDALGRTDYEQRYTGSGTSSYSVYATTRYTYDFAGDLIQVLHPDGVTTTTVQYDMAGRATGMTDPDRGAESYGYDANSNLVQLVDARGSAGTTFIGYDGIDRPLWRNTQNGPTGAYATFSYDGTAGGNAGVGRLTGDSFTNGTLSGGNAFTYDPRGRQVARTETVGGAGYPVQATYDDAGHVLTTTYPTGETVTDAYTSQGWLSGVSTRQGTASTNLLSGVTYSGTGGAIGEITGGSLGGGRYTYSAAYDLLGRNTDMKLTKSGGSPIVFEQARTFDPVGNVSTARTTLPTGTDSQAFCYDEQNRLTWAGSTGTPPCTGSPISAGSLGSALYTQSFGYDTMGRLTTGPLGAYTYGSSAHVHAATAVGSGYTASYDTAGDMSCRAPTGSTTCAGSTPNGAQLGYDNEGRLVSWQGAGASDRFLYDGRDHRVAQQVTQGGASTTTVYLGGLEAVTTSGATTTTKTYYSAGGRRIAMGVNGTIGYLASDGLDSTSVALSAGGSAIASQLFAPYGGVRYTNGTMPTEYGFTGQLADAASGLDYYQARYYDPVAGQFTSADTVVPGGGFNLWGLSRFAYVEGDPSSKIDPTGRNPIISFIVRAGIAAGRFIGAAVGRTMQDLLLAVRRLQGIVGAMSKVKDLGKLQKDDSNKPDTGTQSTQTNEVGGQQATGGESVSGDIGGQQATGGESVGGDVGGQQATGGESVGGDLGGQQAAGGESVGGDVGGQQAMGGESVGGDVGGQQAAGGDFMGGDLGGQQPMGGDFMGGDLGGQQPMGGDSMGGDLGGQQPMGGDFMGGDLGGFDAGGQTSASGGGFGGGDFGGGFDSGFGGDDFGGGFDSGFGGGDFGGGDCC